MNVDDPGFWFAVLQIIWIDILLSGDNAVVIALACRKLPPQQRLWGIVLGTIVAISLRVVFAGAITTLMQVAYLKLVGGALLVVDRRQAARARGERQERSYRAGRQSLARDQDRRHRRCGDEPRQCRRHRRGRREIRGAAKLCASDVRSCRQHSLDHGWRGHRHVDPRALPDRGVGGRRAARLDRRRDHRQGSRCSPPISIRPRRIRCGWSARHWAPCSWSARGWCGDACCGEARPIRSELRRFRRADAFDGSAVTGLTGRSAPTGPPAT